MNPLYVLLHYYHTTYGKNNIYKDVESRKTSSHLILFLHPCLDYSCQFIKYSDWSSASKLSSQRSQDSASECEDRLECDLPGGM